MINNDCNPRGRAKGAANQKHVKNASNLNSPYSKQAPKARSLSSSKQNSSTKSMSSLLVQSKTIFKEPHFKQVMKNPLLRTTGPEIRFENAGEENLEKKLSQDLKLCKNDEEIFEIHQRYFAEVIKKNKKHGKVLAVIKSCYDSRVSQSEKGVVNKLKNEIKELQNSISKEHKDKQLYVKKIEKLAKENVELSRTLDATEEKYNNLVVRIQEIRKFNVESLPKDELTWKTLVHENQSLAKINKEMQSDIKSISTKEKKLVNLIFAIKQRGVPVEEIYEKQNSKSKRSYSPQSYVEDTDNEALISGRAKKVDKPTIIPTLNLKGVQPELSSDDSFSSGMEQ